MGFEYRDLKINILDTPGHQDFAEDTFRTLTAVDSAIVVIDVAKGVETQTEKLVKFVVCDKHLLSYLSTSLIESGKMASNCWMRLKLNWIDRKTTFLACRNGTAIPGVYNLYEKKLVLFRPHSKQSAEEVIEITDLDSDELDKQVGEKAADIYVKR